jgi:uncharacterized membrane protein
MTDITLALKLIHVLGAAVLFGTGLGIAYSCGWRIAPTMPR